MSMITAAELLGTKSVAVAERRQTIARAKWGTKSSTDRNWQRGETHYRASLSNASVRRMRALYSQWKVEDKGKPAQYSRGYRYLSTMFECSPQTAKDIVRGRTRIDAGGPIYSEDE